MFPLRRALLALTAVAALGTAGCGAGFNAGTMLVQHPADGAYATLGPARVINAVIVLPPDGGTGVLSMAVTVGRGAPAEQITGIHLAKGQAQGGQGITVPGDGGVVQIGTGSGTPQVTVTGLQPNVDTVVRVTVQLNPSGPVSLDVPVYTTNQSEYATLTPSATPTP